MATPVHYVHQLPYSVVRALGQLLDPGNVWAEIGGRHSMGLSVTTVNDLSHRYRSLGESPTEALMKMWGAKNYTVNDLYMLLLKMEHHQAMGLIKRYVDERYHPLHSEGNRLSYPVETMLIPVQQRLSPPASKSVLKPQNQQQPRSNSASKMTNYVDPLNLDQPKEANSHSKTISNKEFNIENNLSIRAFSQSVCSTCHSCEQCRCGSRSVGSKNSAENPPRLPVVDSNITRPSNSPSTVHTDNSLSANESVIQLSFNDIITCTEDFKQSNIVGKGGFGTVYRGKLRSNIVAVKVIEKKNMPGPPRDQEAKLQHSFDELRALNRYRHENILVLHGYSFQLDCLCLVYQYMVNGSLEDRLLCRHGTDPLSWSQRCNILRGTACGLQYLHTITTIQFIHGDIKSANILLDSQLQAKIGDFGLAREGPHTEKSFTVVSTIKGTQAYLPNEYLCGNQLSTKVDVYSFGVVVYEVGTGRRAYQINLPISKEKLLVDLVDSWPEVDLDRLIDTKAGTENCLMYRKLMALGKICTKKSKKQRPDMEEVHVTLIQLIENMADESKQSNITTATVHAESSDKPPGLAKQKPAPPNVTAGSCDEYTPPPSYGDVFPPKSLKNGQQSPESAPQEQEGAAVPGSFIPPLSTEDKMIRNLPAISELFATLPTATGKKTTLDLE